MMYSSEIEHQKLSSSDRSSKGPKDWKTCHTLRLKDLENAASMTVLKHLCSRKEFMMDQLIKLITQTSI